MSVSAHIKRQNKKFIIGFQLIKYPYILCTMIYMLAYILYFTLERKMIIYINYILIYINLMLGQQCRRWTSIKPGITGYLVYCCAALYIVYPVLKEHHLLLLLLFVNSIQNKVMALVPHILVTST